MARVRSEIRAILNLGSLLDQCMRRKDKELWIKITPSLVREARNWANGLPDRRVKEASEEQVVEMYLDI